MSGRVRLDYGAGAAARSAAGVDPDRPAAGFYCMRLRSGNVFVGVRIWFGPPHDPVTGEELDRSHRWQATANGEPIDLDRVWPKCAGDPISAPEFAYLAARKDWAEEHAPDSPAANPNKPVDMLSAPIPF